MFLLLMKRLKSLRLTVVYHMIVLVAKQFTNEVRKFALVITLHYTGDNMHSLFSFCDCDADVTIVIG